MDWSSGYSSRCYISVVDRLSWRDVDEINITGGTVKRAMSDLRDSADINCVRYSSDREQIIRVWLDAKQGGTSSHTPLFTGLATSPGRNINGRYETNTLQCYSILKIAQDILLPRGWYAPAAANGASLVKNLLSVIGAPMQIAEHAPTLKYAIIAEQNENNLSMADKILDAMDWRMRISGRGEIIIEPIVREPIGLFGASANDVIELSLSVSYDWYNCPNVYRAVIGDTSAVARDDSLDSPFSTVNRGREVWVEDNGCYLSENETLADYARRRLKEAQQVNTSISYTRRFDPNIMVEDIVTLNYPEQGILGNYLITSQSIDLSRGGRTSEEVIKV